MILVSHNFLPLDTVNEIGAAVRGIYASLDKCDTLAPECLRASYRHWNGLRLDALAEMMERDPNDLMGLIGDRLADRSIEREPVPEPSFSYFRRAMFGTPSAVQWHCDAEAASTLPLGECVNVWVPFERVGGCSNMPSIEVITDSDRVMRVRADLKLCGHRSDDFAATVGLGIVIPLVPGDALIFDHYTLHRTQPMPTQTRPRLSAEFRFSFKEDAK